MLTIREEQMQALSGLVLEQYERRMVEHLRATFPDRTKNLQDDRIRAAVQSCVKNANDHGIVYEDDIRRFIEYVVIYGTALDARAETRWIGDILRRDDLDGTAKMDLIDSLELQSLRI
jgi:hypothetical protein